MEGDTPELFDHDRDTARDTRLVERAIRKRWPIPDEYKTAVINRLVKIAIDPAVKEREAIQAGRAVIQAEGQNQSDEHAASGKGGVNVNVGVAVGVQVGDVRREILNDEEYLDFCRGHIGDAASDHAGNGHTGMPRGNGKPRPVAPGKPSADARPGHNGHHHGTNGSTTHRDDAPEAREE